MRPAPPRLFHSFVVAALAALTAFALLGVSRVAHAQVVQGISAPVVRLEADGKTSADIAHPHLGGVPLNAINYEDCAANLEYQFQLALTGPTAAYSLVAFAGSNADCTVTENRTLGTSSCYPVAAYPITQGSATAATVIVRMQDLALQAASAAPAVTYSAAGIEACTAQPTSAATGVSIYFFFVDGNNNPIGVAQAYPITVDTQAAVVNGAIGTIPSSNTLTVTIPGESDTDITGWNVYCDPPPGQETIVNEVPYDAASNQGICTVDSGQTTAAEDAASEASGAEASTEDASGASEQDASLDAASSDASADASDAAPVRKIDDAGGSACGVVLNDGGVIPSTGGCYPSALFSTSAVTILGSEEAGPSVTGGLAQSLVPTKYLCGVAGATDTTVTISGLKDGYYYNIAVGATDAVGNVGPLATACGNPNPPTDFYTRYVAAGGLAGGGFCATDGVGVPAGTSALLILVVAAGAALVRRRLRA